jgi:hypothetical protein
MSSSAAGEPPQKRSKTAAVDVDVMEKVSYIFVPIFSHRMRATQHRPDPKQPAVDFFGRLIMTPTEDKNKPTSSRKQAKPAYVVAFRYKMGSSAAVRKSVKMASFL